MSGVAAGRRRFKRFYSKATLEPGARAVVLDGRPAKTLAGAALAAPSIALAAAIAAEWEGAGETIDIDALPLTRLAMTAIDLGPRDRHQWAEEVIGYLKSDHLCYRAEEPAALVARQEETWSRYLDWAREALGAELRLATGIVAVVQEEAALAGARRRLSAMDDWSLIGVRTAAGVTGSAILGLALEARAFPPGDLFAASRIDERFQTERWGEDAEAKAREAALERDFMALARWFALLAEGAAYRSSFTPRLRARNSSSSSPRRVMSVFLSIESKSRRYSRI